MQTSHARSAYAGPSNGSGRAHSAAAAATSGGGSGWKEYDLADLTATVLEDVRRGLQSLDEEEQGLLQLRGQLAQLKSVKEEQRRKDGIICVLQERVAVLESEASSSNIQNAELQHVLTEHISRLESSSVEHEQLVQRYEELRQSQQLIAAAREEEMRTFAELKASHDLRSEELIALRAGAMADKQIMRQMEENLVALRDDLKRRDSETRTETSHSTELISRLQSELQLARETVDEMARKMVDYDDMKLRTESSLLRARKEVDKYRRDRDTCRQEGEKWRRMYQELEQALDVVKSQGASQRDKQSKEVSRLQEDLAASNQKVEELRAEAAVVSAVFTSVARDSDAISTLRPPNSSHEMISQHAEIAAIVKSIKRLLAATPRGLTPEMRKVIKFMCELVHKTVVYQEESSGLSDELAQRSDTLESATKLFERLEDKLRTVKADLTLSDEIVRHVLLLTQQSGEQKHFLKTFVEKRDFHFNSQTRQKLFVELLESVHQLLQTLQSTNSSAYSQRNEAQLLQQRHEHYVEVLRLQHEQELEEAHTAVNVAQDECSREIAKHREENMRLLAQSKADFHSQLEEYKEQVVFYRENERNLRDIILTLEEKVCRLEELLNNARDAQERQLAQISLFEKERKQRRMNLVKDIQSDLYVDVEIANNDDNRWSYSQPAEAVSSPVHSRLEELKNKLLEIDSRKNTPTNAYVSSSEKVSSSKTASLSSCNSAKRVSEKRSAAPVSPAHHRLEELKQRLLGSEAKFASSSHSICEDDGIENRTESRKRTTDESLRSILKNSDTQRVTRSSYATVAESSRSMNSLAARSEGNIYPQLDFSQDGQLDASPFTRKELSASGEGIRGSRAKRYSSDAKIASQEPPLETTSNINTRDFSINHSQTLSGENFGEEVNHSREGVDDDDDDVIYEIYSDIGRLTGRLENSMRSSRSSLVSGLESKITNCSFSLASEDREYDNSLDRISSIKK